MNGSSLNEYGRIQDVGMRHPKDAFVSQAAIDAQWQRLNYHAAPDFHAACSEFDALAQLLSDHGAAIHLLPPAPALSLDAIYVRDATALTPGGFVSARMGKTAREPEPQVAADFYTGHGFTPVGALESPARLEGGDLVWLDDTTLIAGHTYRTNPNGIETLRQLAGPEVQVMTAHMPHYLGPSDVFHLMSVFSPLDRDLALVYLPLMPVPLVQLLQDRGFGFVEVPEEEFTSMACNVLAIAPRTCVAVDGNPITRQRMEAAGCTVLIYQGDNISRFGEGGPTCLTRPLRRV